MLRALWVIFTVQTLTQMSTFYTSSVALAVILATWRFLTRAFFSWNKRRDSLEISWISKVSHLFRMIYFMLIFRMVVASHTYAIFVADSPLWKALAVQFQAIYFTTLASWMLLIFIYHLFWIGGCECALRCNIVVLLI